MRESLAIKGAVLVLVRLDFLDSQVVRPELLVLFRHLAGKKVGAGHICGDTRLVLELIFCVWLLVEFLGEAILDGTDWAVLTEAIRL